MTPEEKTPEGQHIYLYTGIGELSVCSLEDYQSLRDIRVDLDEQAVMLNNQPICLTSAYY
jgi:hypothetical protein